MDSSSRSWRGQAREGWSSPEAPPVAVRLGRGFGALIWIAFTYAMWFDVTRDDLAAALGSGASPRAVTGAAIMAVVSRAASQLIEAGFYAMFWKLRSRRVHFGAMYVAVLSLSVLDALAQALMRWIGPEGASPWWAAMVGLRVIPEALAAQPGLRIALGGVGLLALARIAGTAWAQRREGVRWRSALLLTACLWLAGRVTTWWSTDLLRGMSPLP